MSEQAFTPPLRGIRSDAAATSTGAFPQIRSGKIAEPAGNILPEKPAEQPDVQVLVEKLNLAALNIGHDLHFEVDLEKGLAIIQVVDRQTGDIVRQIPAEKASLAIRENGDFQIRLFDALI